MWTVASLINGTWSAVPFSELPPQPPTTKAIRALCANALPENRQNLFGTPNTPNQDVQEVWFAGVHSDVGGCYPEAESRQLSKLALRWMVCEAELAGPLMTKIAGLTFWEEDLLTSLPIRLPRINTNLPRAGGGSPSVGRR